MSDGKLIRTALYDEHVDLGGNIVDFHGFELPIWYSNIKAEHLATRESAGLFDVSHMGTFRFSGPNVREWLETIATQKVSSITAGRCAYTHFLDNDGFIIDDMIFAVVSETEILGVPNASMIDVMWDWFQGFSPSESGITIENLSPETSIIALQGPTSKVYLDAAMGHGQHVGRFKWREFSENQLGVTGWIQGTGYTGEPGYEIFVPNEQVATVWRALIMPVLPLLDSAHATPFVSRKDTSFRVLISSGPKSMMEPIPSSLEIHGKRMYRLASTRSMSSLDVIVYSLTHPMMLDGGESSISNVDPCRDQAKMSSPSMVRRSVS